MKRYILTGTPGSGKTSLIRFLENAGYDVVEEAATDIIALEQGLGIDEPWEDPYFVDKIVTLQKQRQMETEVSSKLQFFDRSPIDAYALSLYLKIPLSEVLLRELARIKRQKIYQKKVFFIENLGFCTPSEARKISFKESLVFEKIHEKVYRSYGYKCIKIAAKPVAERAKEILSLI